MSHRSGHFPVETPKDTAQDSQISELQAAVTALTQQVNSLSVSSSSIVTAFNIIGNINLVNYGAFAEINSVTITTTSTGYIWAMLSADITNNGSGYGQAYFRIDINNVGGQMYQYQLFPNQTNVASINQRSGLLPPGTYTVKAYGSQQYVSATINYGSLYAHGNLQ